MRRSIIVTGAGGFLGFHIAKSFLGRGYRLIALDNFSSGFRDHKKHLESLSEDCIFLEADACDSWDQILSPVPAEWLTSLQSVFHFASPASPPRYRALSLETLRVNSVGLQEALRLADLYGAHLIFASSSEVYGCPEVSPQSESYLGAANIWGPRSCYVEAKRFGESLIYHHNQRYGTCHGVVRIFNTYGPEMNPCDGRVIINLLLQALQDRPLTIYGKGLQTRSFCYIDDFLRALEIYANRKFSRPVNIGNDVEIQIIELAKWVKRITGKEYLELQFSEIPADDPQQRRPDISLAKELLSPWRPVTSLGEGLTTTYDWLRQICIDQTRSEWLKALA